MSSCLVAIWLAVVATGDQRTGRIPNALVWPGVVAVVCSSVVHPVIGYSALVTALPYLVGALSGMSGGGDLKLAVVTGGLVADPGLGAMTVLTAAIIHLIGRRPCGHRRHPRPHAPALVAASVVALGLG